MGQGAKMPRSAQEAALRYAALWRQLPLAGLQQDGKLGFMSFKTLTDTKPAARIDLMTSGLLVVATLLGHGAAVSQPRPDVMVMVGSVCTPPMRVGGWDGFCPMPGSM